MVIISQINDDFLHFYEIKEQIKELDKNITKKTFRVEKEIFKVKESIENKFNTSEIDVCKDTIINRFSLNLMIIYSQKVYDKPT